MSDERIERCPRCGANASDHVALATPGIVTPCKWACGTYRVLATGEIVESEDCLRRQLARAQERINWLEGQWIAIRDMVSCDGDMVDDLIPYVEAVMEDYHAYHTQKRKEADGNEWVDG